jgi:sensor histidine kinase YesM
MVKYHTECGIHWYCLCRLLVTTSADQTARVWKTSDFTLLQELRHEAQRWVWDVAFSADSQYILTGSYASYIIIIISSSSSSSTGCGRNSEVFENYKYLALGPVLAGTRVQSGDRYGCGTLHSGLSS